MKNLSFRNLIILGVFIFFTVSTVMAFYTFNKFHFNNTKNGYIKDNIRLAKVVKEEIETEKQNLEIKAKTVVQDAVLFNALANNVYLQIPGVKKNKDVEVKIKKMNRLGYLKISNKIFSKIAGEPGYFMGEIYLEIFDKELKRVASVGGLSGDFLDKGDDEHIVDAFGNGKFQISGSMNTLVDKGGKLFIKAIKDVYVDQAYGLVVISKPLNEFYISEIKRKINKEIIIIKDNEMYISTIYNGAEMVKGKKIDIENCDGLCYKEMELAGKKYGFTIFPMTDYKNKTVALMGIGYNLGEMESFYRASMGKFVIFQGIFSIILLIGIYMFFNKVFKPFAIILEGIKKIKDGDYTYSIDLKRGGELKVLADNINELGETIGKRESELTELNEEILRKNKQLMHLDELKDEFLANTSHELKTPLNGIIGIAETLVEGVAGKLEIQVQKNLEMIISSGKRLGALVNDILDFSKLKNSEIRFQIKSIDLKELIFLVITLSRTLLKGKKIKLISDMPESLFIKGDENRIQQIMYNLLGNAIKFTESGYVKVRAKREGNDVIIEVEDTGIGIAKSKQEKIFEAFEQVDGSTARKYSGTGLGLGITKKLIDLMGGTISLKSELGKGSIFTVRIPMNQKVEPINEKVNVIVEYEDEQVINAENKNDVLSSKERKTILIVDDEPINITVLKNYFSMKNYDILIALNGEDAIKIVEEQRTEIDLILLDVMMPGMSGYEVAEKLRKTYSLYELPILMVTAKNRVEDIEKGLLSGANDYLTKPVEKKELYARAETLISLKKAVETAMNYTKEYEEEKQKREISEEIVEITKSMSSSLMVKGVFDKLLEKVEKRINYNKSFIMIKKNKKYDVIYTNGIEIKDAEEMYSKKLELFNRAGIDGEFSDIYDGRAAIGVLPISYREEVLAYIVLLNEEKIEIKDEKLLYTFLNSAGFAIENAKLFEELENRRREIAESLERLQSVEQMVSLIYTEKDENKVAEYILELMVKEKEFSFGKGACLKLKHDKENFSCLAIYNEDKFYKSNELIKISDFLSLNELVKKNENIFNDKENIQIKDIVWENYLLSPIIYKDNLYGVFIFETSQDNIDIMERSATFNIFSKNLAIYFKNKELEEEGHKNLKLSTILNLSQAIVHEIRTPLSGIKGFASIAKNKLKELQKECEQYENETLIKGREKLNEYMEIMLNEAERVDEMANDLLEYSMISRDDIKLEKLNLRYLILELLENRKKEIEESEIKLNLNFENEVFIEGEKERLIKVFSHILKNSIEAVDFLKTSKDLDITIKNENAKVVLLIKDNGVGISPEIIENIFEPMVTSKIQGTGLGLTISKGILESYGASMEIKSEFGKFTEVKIEF